MAPVNIGGVNADGAVDWRISLSRLTARVDAAYKVERFDVALLSCGGLGMLLGHHLVQQGRSAVYVGGWLQVLFGIMGQRWVRLLKNREHPLSAVWAAHRTAWTRPLPQETPPRASSVEEKAYWRL